jgi:hypothetical protein
MGYEEMRKELKAKTVAEMEEHLGQTMMLMKMIGLEMVVRPDKKEVTFHSNGPLKHLREKLLRPELNQLLDVTVTISATGRLLEDDAPEECLHAYSIEIAKAILNIARLMMMATREFSKVSSEEEAMAFFAPEC